MSFFWVSFHLLIWYIEDSGWLEEQGLLCECIFFVIICTGRNAKKMIFSYQQIFNIVGKSASRWNMFILICCIFIQKLQLIVFLISLKFLLLWKLILIKSSCFGLGCFKIFSIVTFPSPIWIRSYVDVNFHFEKKLHFLNFYKCAFVDRWLKNCFLLTKNW